MLQAIEANRENRVREIWVVVTERICFDTSVLVAALIKEHPHHGAAESLLNDVFGDKKRQVVVLGIDSRSGAIADLPG